MNYGWVRDAFGKPAADAIADDVILNSGAILGRKTAVMKLLDDIARVTKGQNYEFADQGTLNYLAHTGRLNHCGRIRIARAGLSLVNNCGFTEIDVLKHTRPITASESETIAFIPRDAGGRLKLYRDPEGWVLDDDGTVSHAVHQYDRFSPDIDDFVFHLSSYQHPDDVFVHGGNRQYRGEKFILFSRFRIDPTAVQMLIRKIKGVSVGTKPLLVVNRNFKHGFVFAYGVLHNEILFESETFRPHFSEEAATSEKCDAFCREWGYRPVFVEEDELLRTHSPWVDPVILRFPPASSHPRLAWDGTTALVPGRECGGCTVCCPVLWIDAPDIQKASGAACRHCSGGLRHLPNQAAGMPELPLRLANAGYFRRRLAARQIRRAGICGDGRHFGLVRPVDRHWVDASGQSAQDDPAVLVPGLCGGGAHEFNPAVLGPAGSARPSASDDCTQHGRDARGDSRAGRNRSVGSGPEDIAWCPLLSQRHHPFRQ